ncbi:hypothetical protein GP486_002918 [Trichoglossum hirsutum]|uniref:Transcription initiation factor TFIID subunit 8 n=1 Tax=Trichoglossum hirsutum TaxID=265104 RepID=A0A9P8RRN9_9PEZI|nr:hypothetical protein GP486_002918 [Trichoglossum hirsutum]
MATTVSSSLSLKRPSPLSSLDASTSKKRRKVSTHRHHVHHRQSFHPDSAAIPLNTEIIQSLLERAIGLILTAVGFSGVDPGALQAFRVHVEEYMMHQLSNISLSMTSSRRSQPIPQDFAFALWKEKLPLSCLGPHLQSLLPPSISQRSLPTPPPEDPPTLPLSPILGPDLSGALDKQKALYIPIHFPSLPGKHTYKATPEFTERERDPRKVRERATEEGRLGEDALRRLLGAASSGGHRTSSSPNSRSTKLKQRNGMWEQTVEALVDGAGTSGLSGGDSGNNGSRISATDNKGLAATSAPEFGVVVNSEKEYWRKSAVSAQDGLRRQQKDVVAVQNEDVLMSGAGLISAP